MFFRFDNKKEKEVGSVSIQSNSDVILKEKILHQCKLPNVLFKNILNLLLIASKRSIYQLDLHLDEYLISLITTISRVCKEWNIKLIVTLDYPFFKVDNIRKLKYLYYWQTSLSIYFQNLEFMLDLVWTQREKTLWEFYIKLLSQIFDELPHSNKIRQIKGFTTVPSLSLSKWGIDFIKRQFRIYGNMDSKIAKITKLQALDLSSDSSERDLVEIINSSRSFRDLNIRTYQPSNELIAALISLPHLTCLTIQQAMIVDKKMVDLLNGFQQLQSLTLMNVNAGFSEKRYRATLELMSQNTTIKQLHLYGQFTLTIDVLVNLYNENSTLELLDIPFVTFEASPLRTDPPPIHNNTLRYLNSNCVASSMNWPGENWLAQDSGIEVLKLKKGTKKCKNAIMESHISKLKELEFVDHLDRDMIGNGLLVPLLQLSTQLVYLSVSREDGEADLVSPLFQALKQNQVLQCLKITRYMVKLQDLLDLINSGHISLNRLEIEQQPDNQKFHPNDLIDPICNNKNLTALSLSNSVQEWHNASFDLIKQVLSRNRNLLHFNYTNNLRFPEKYAETFKHLIKDITRSSASHCSPLISLSVNFIGNSQMVDFLLQHTLIIALYSPRKYKIENIFSV
ncbi:hypothetical protein DLAC_01253 [Tieghemostelium lacteum]|uniref:Uncharacterized protein n=1 Tax=Tieghemostelium lacteum TaxID=361077 RepID=A0A152A895_TIELA|nr:hypothetical protein DLAC_01253 [Tieghemostelium lacteum]|eukprot:KYR02414.1 hypothetical protein DLAC_01253 [Tieghemostelium lacteum]